ncbi:unnamed protein product [Merluccius merluccius]
MAREGDLEDEDDGVSVESKCRVMGYLCQFVTTVSQDVLKQLIKFWIGWEIPMADMRVEVSLEARNEHVVAAEEVNTAGQVKKTIFLQLVQHSVEPACDHCENISPQTFNSV